MFPGSSEYLIVSIENLCDGLMVPPYETIVYGQKRGRGEDVQEGLA